MQRVIGREAGMNGDRRTEMQCRRGLDVHAADMEERQHGQHMIVRGHGMHVLAHHAVPQQRFLRQHRTFWPPGGAGGVNDQQRRVPIDVRLAPVAAAGVDQRRQIVTRLRCVVQADNPRLRQHIGERRADRIESGFDEQRLHLGIAQDEHLFGHREAPVQRHQHRTQSRTGIKQRQILGRVKPQHGNPVAAMHAELRLHRARQGSDARGKNSVAPRLSLIPQRRLVRREGGVAVDQIGQVHQSSVSPS